LVQSLYQQRGQKGSLHETETGLGNSQAGGKSEAQGEAVTQMKDIKWPFVVGLPLAAFFTQLQGQDLSDGQTWIKAGLSSTLVFLGLFKNPRNSKGKETK